MAKFGATHSMEAEQSLLGALLVNNQAMSMVDSLEAEHFFEPLHGQIFDICRTLIADGKLASPITVRAFLPKDIKIADGMNELQYLARLCAESTTILNANDFAKLIVSYAEKRSIIEVVRDLAADDGDPAEAARIALENIDSVRMGMVHRAGRQTRGSAIDAVTEAIDRMTAIMQGEETPGGIPTGVKAIDGKLGGMIPGNLVVIAGRPGAGKSTVAESLARQVAAGGTGSYFFSFEMPQRSIGARLLADQALTERRTLPYDRILRGDVTDDEAEHLVLAARDITEFNLPLEFDYASRPTVAMIAAKCRRMQAVMRQKYKAELGVVWLDYLKFIQSTNRYQGQRVLEVGEITGALKSLALDTGLCIVLMVQLNREVEKRSDKIPVLSDLRESGDIEQDADQVIFLYRKAYYLQTDPNLETDVNIQVELEKCYNLVQAIVAKNRMGPVGTIDLFCDMGASAIRDQPESAHLPGPPAQHVRREWKPDAGEEFR